ncbi:MAG: hypothetical protein RLZ98_1224 [Pseudomonadota bacterium]|jgi:2-methylaconitate cis-trans-isomerase PrpF
MPQNSVPCLFMRGGTSRGPFLNRAHLPDDLDALAEMLISAVGAGHPINIDGIGGGTEVTTKVVMVSPSKDEWADIDYFFAQVAVGERQVDYSPTCGNMLSGVAPAAIELGLFPAQEGETRVKILSVNTGARIEAIVQTPGGVVEYEGNARIDGVPGTAAPIVLNFMDVIGSSCGALFPTGKTIENIDGIDVTCIDVAMPMALARADAFGLTGYETREELDANRAFYARMEPIRREAGRRMGLGDVSDKVVPKFGILSAPRSGGAINARYFMPKTCHPSLAVTGSICIGSCILSPGTVAEGISVIPDGSPVTLEIEHPMGQIEVAMDYSATNGFELKSAGILRTARKLMEGQLFVPSSVMAKEKISEPAE